MNDEDIKRLQARNEQLEELVSKAAEAMGFIRWAAICYGLNGSTWSEEAGFGQKMTNALMKRENLITQLKKDLADADLLLGEEWRTPALQGDVKAQREKIIADLVATNRDLKEALKKRRHEVDDFHRGYIGCEGQPCVCHSCAEIKQLLKLI